MSVCPGYVTTGAPTLPAGGSVQFQFNCTTNGVPTYLTGGTASLLVKDPTGTVTSYTASVGNGTAISQAIVFSILGSYTRTWQWVSGGVTYKTLPIGFLVVASP
jgi:hypothetical protein